MLIPKHIINKSFGLFLDDAFPTLSDSIAFSPPANRNNIAIVDPITINNHFYIDGIRRMLSFSRPYSDRQESVYWRGALTGQVALTSDLEKDEYISSVFDRLQRTILCYLAQRYPDLFNCRITSANQWLYSEEIEARLACDELLAEPDPFERNLEFKYLIDIDGNSNSWPGFFMKLASGSCVFKIESPCNFFQWYYKYLTPWKHYVPVSSDMSDLQEKVNYIRRNPHEGQKIAISSAAFILDRSPLDWARLAIQDLSISLELIL